jgi:hypothetical protein
MPKVQYLGPYDRRELDRRAISEDPSAPLEEGEEPEILVWERDGDSVELTDDEFSKLTAITGGSTWALTDEEGADAIDESSSEPESAEGVPKTIEVEGTSA